jgi:phenylalanyl-tRNA synthetase beta chain
LQEVLGDVLFNIELTPNLARCYSILGVAREVAALLGKPVRYPSFEMVAEGPTIEGEVAIEIQEPELNPRFTLTLLRNTKIQPAPRWMQYRLRLVGQRPINNIVDVTNYITFEIGQPLHAFDYDKLKARAGKKTPTIITRLPKPGETLDTLDEKTRELDAHNILVCDTKGVLSLGGVIGGAETEISDSTTNVLLEAANWNFINIRRTMQSQKVNTDAGLRFSRGVHPSQSILGVKRGIELMRQTGGGSIAQGVIDEYPRPVQPAQIELPVKEIKRLLGMEISIEQILDILWWLEFKAQVKNDVLHITAPDYRMDIGSGVVGRSDLIEEIARIYGYDRMYDTIIADEMPPQWANTALEREERSRDVLVALGLRETISYRMTTPERELALTPQNMSQPGADYARLWDSSAYVELANPLTPERAVMRHTLLGSLIENALTNQRTTARQQLFEVGQVYFKREGAKLPDEYRRLGLLITGARRTTGWTQDEPAAPVDFFDLKAMVEGLLNGLHIQDAQFQRSSHPSLHPGRSASVFVNGQRVGDFGELHPVVARQIEWEGAPLYVGEFDLDALLADVNTNYPVRALATTPPVLQDIALVMGDDIESARVEAVIRKAGGDLLKGLTLFDVYRGDPIPAGHKSLAYSLVYRADDRTLTDKEVAMVHQKIVKTVERELGAKLRA